MDRRDLLLVLIGAGEGRVAGITRLQKMLFLLQQEYGISVSGEPVHFEAYRFGPYSPDLYDDLEFLETIGFVESRDDGRPLAADKASDDVLDTDFSFLAPRPASSGPSDEELVERQRYYEDSDTDAGGSASDLGPDREYRLTERARSHLRERLGGDAGLPEADAAARELKRRFPRLNSLIRYVYTKYPQFVSESEIRDEILGR